MVNRIKGILLALAALVACGEISAQSTDALGTYTPYSLFGVGDLMKQGTAYNMGMGGIGIGVRGNRFINYLNPASITARDTLSFMMDFGLNQQNYYNTDGKHNSAYNTFNIQNVLITAPIYRKSAFIIGITPFSNVGYKFQNTESDPVLVSRYGNINYQKYGEGSINQVFVGASMNLFTNFSLGAQYMYFFGSLDKFSNVVFDNTSTVRGIDNNWNYSIKAHSAKVGLQYFGKLNDKLDITAGATYRMKAKFNGDLTKMVVATDNSKSVDTVANNVIKDPDMCIPSEIGVGVSLSRKNKWMMGLDYKRQDWGKSDLPEVIGVNFKPVASNTVNLGFEYVPNMYDIRYYLKRVTYRVGAYYEDSYLKVNNKQVNAFGITLGASLPIYRLYNAVNFSVDLGQRGSKKDNLVRERYVKFIVNISLHDIWFIKQKYQ